MNLHIAYYQSYNFTVLVREAYRMYKYMCMFNRTCLAFVRDQEGPTATEYAIMLAMILMVALGAIGTFGNTLSGLFVDIKTALFAA